MSQYIVSIHLILEEQGSDMWVITGSSMGEINDQFIAGQNDPENNVKYVTNIVVFEVTEDGRIVDCDNVLIKDPLYRILIEEYDPENEE